VALEKKHVVPAICALVAVGGVAYIVTRPSDEAQIKKTIARLTDAVAPHPNEQNIIGTVARISGVFKETLTERVEISLPEVRDLPSARADLAKAAAQVSVHYPTATLSVDCAKIAVAEDKITARGDCEVTLRDDRDGPREDKRRVNFGLRKDDGWRVTSINVAERQPR